MKKPKKGKGQASSEAVAPLAPIDLRIPSADRPRDEAAATRKDRIKASRDRSDKLRRLAKKRESQGKSASADTLRRLADSHKRDASELKRIETAQEKTQMTATVDIVAPEGSAAIVTKSLRDAPLDRLHARKQINDCEYSAGDWCRSLFELFGTEGVRAMDFSKPVVDGSATNANLGVTDAQLRAGKRLKNIAVLLGAEGFGLVVDVLARRKFIEQAARDRNLHSQRDKDFLARRFRECLDTISILGGFKVSGAVRRTVGDKHAQSARSANKPELHRALTAAEDADRLDQFRQFLTMGGKPVAKPKLELPREGEAA